MVCPTDVARNGPYAPPTLLLYRAKGVADAKRLPEELALL